jgi:hypothetical protein
MSEWTRIPARELLRIQTTSKKIESVPVHKLDRPIAVTRGVTRATAYNKCSYDCTNSLYNFVIRHAPWALERAWPRARAPAPTRRAMDDGAHALALRLLALQSSMEREADRDRAHRWSRSVARPLRHRRVGGEGGFGEVCARASTPLATPWALIFGGSLGCFRVVSGGSAPDGGLPGPQQGTSGHLHTSCNSRALLFARGCAISKCSPVSFPLIVYITPDQQL